MIRFILICACLISSVIYAQESPKKTLHIERTDTPPKIDGVLDDDVWKIAQEATNFTQFRPDMGVKLESHQRTTVKMTYDDDAIYVAAYLKDKPEDIQRQLTSRDNFGQSDFFAVVLNPNNDAQNDTQFFVFSSGTQADAIANPSIGEDFGWNAVWDSAVQLVDDGWIVEIKLPYRTLRFSNQEVQTWGLQFHRNFRLTNSQYSWNPIDRTKGNIGLYHGELTGITNIKPPTRLIFYPFASFVFDNMQKPDFNHGMDVKYGITENFTLDATLIPDFSQAGFDNVRLNLGPFEQTFSEQRQFFTEGVDLFNKGDLFFSRRIGGAPRGSISTNEDEEIDYMPDNVKVINAVKLSGRTKKGWGIGFFNAITEKTDVRIRNIETNETRNETIEPLTNYNVFVVDKQFNGNSSIGLVTTSVLREGSFRDAYASALVTDFSNKKNTYNIISELKISQPEFNFNGNFGVNSFFLIRKSHGKYRYSFDHSFSNERYNINDLGLNFRNNFNNFGVDVNYRIFEPTKKLNNFFINAYANYRRLYNPSTFTGTNFGIFAEAQNKKLIWYGVGLNYEPGNQYDYFEPRDFENKRYFVYRNLGSINSWVNTNDNKFFSFFIRGNMWHIFDNSRDLFGYVVAFEPRFRINDKFRMSYEVSYNNNKGSRGFVTNYEDDIIFGERDILTIENSISGSYNFNPFHTLALTFRNYWSTVTYDRNLYTLQENGDALQQGLTTSDISNPNVNFNTWNLDLSYSWQVAPGSFLTALYRNQLFNSNTNSQDSYFDSLGTLFEQDIQHIFSIKLQYFLDYNNIKNVFKKKNT